MIATLVETKELWQTVVVASGTGIGVTFLFSLGIWGSGQFLELSRGDRQVAATAAGIVGLLAFIAVAAAVIAGIIVMTQK
jgi:hypothetical protein